MEILLIVSFICAFIIGITLGMIGGGGSILTVPVLVYLSSLDTHTAITYSLFIIGVSSAIASIQNAIKKTINYKIAILFALPAFVVIYAIRKFLLPAIPEEILTIGNFTLSKSLALMLFFAVVMLIASISMIRGRKENTDQSTSKKQIPMLLLQGIIVGIITGLVGAGGGFLIIPALVFMAKLPMKEAVATSLLVIAVNSIFAFSGDLSDVEIDWKFLLIFTAIAICGVFLGSYFRNRIDGKKLRKIFGWFVLSMGIIIIAIEIFSL